jgi:hypothetical protein
MIKYFWLLLLSTPAHSDMVTIANVYYNGEKCPIESITSTEGSYMIMNCSMGKMVYKYDMKAQSIFISGQDMKNCMPMTKTFLQQMSKMRVQQAQQMAAMKDQLKSMPAEQRKMLEASMGSSVAMAIPKIVATSRTETVKHWECKVFDQMTNGKKVGEMCLASAKDVGMDMTKYKKIVDFMEEMAKLSTGQNQAGDSFKLFRDGMVSVQGKNFENGKMTLAFELEKVSEVPGRYKAVVFPKNCTAKK